MPEYLAPGVYIEEVSFRSKSIEGVSTTTTGFIGPTRYGPIELAPELLTSLADFVRTYGTGGQLDYNGTHLHNYMWHAVRAFFTEGGQRLYVTRTFLADGERAESDQHHRDGRARGVLGGSPATTVLAVSARWPGAAGNVRVRITVGVGTSVLTYDQPTPTTFRPRVSALSERDVVLATQANGSHAFYLATFDEAAQTWQLANAATTLRLTDLQPGGAIPGPDPRIEVRKIQVLTLGVAVMAGDTLSVPDVWTDLALEATHTTNGANDSLAYRFGYPPAENPDQNREIPVVIEIQPPSASGLDLLEALFAASAPSGVAGVSSLEADVVDPKSSDQKRFVEVLLTGGNDGVRPTAAEYEGAAEAGSTIKTGLKQFEDIDDISIVAAPGSTFGYESGYQNDANTIIGELLAHCYNMRYRIAVIDSGNGQTLNQTQAMRARFDSSWGAYYYPWVKVLDPITRVPINLPPSGFVAGIYARNDVTRAVFKAPANEVVNLALGFEITLNKAQQDVLNPEGINCFRTFEGRGNRLWGGRTMSSDPEWKYVNLRRYFAYLEHSIDKGTQWAVFEPNGPALWANVRQTIEDFLLNEFVNGALLGESPAKAYFVRCDRSTMTQNDLDNGRLVCLIGVSPVRPAEFVIFRIGQWTADRK